MTKAHAYVTLVTNADYARGAVALVRSLMRTDTQAGIVVMHTGGVSGKVLAPVAASRASASRGAPPVCMTMMSAPVPVSRNDLISAAAPRL
jgi:hypothetical protein